MKQGDTEDLASLLKQVDIMTVLSCICIDLAKKFYDINIFKEIENIMKTGLFLDKKPNFWKVVSDNDNIKFKVMKYDCPMDELNKIMSLKPAEDIDTISLYSLLVERSLKKGNRNQEREVLEFVDAMCDELNSLYASYKKIKLKTDDDKEEKIILEDDIIKEYHGYMKNRKIKPDTMYSILYHMIIKDCDSTIRLMNYLYSSNDYNKKVFLSAFKPVESN
jgi:CRISPR/Cas system CSM-associated protein Csm2 small subunit